MEVNAPTHKITSIKLMYKLFPPAISLVVSAFFYPTIAHLYERWIKWDEGLSHGLIVIGLFLVLQFKSAPWQPSKNSNKAHVLILMLIALLSSSWFIFHLTNLYILEQLILLPILILTIGGVLGWQASLKYLPLLVFPIFAIPIWDQLSNSLVNLSSFAVGQMVQIINMPAVIDGNSIFIPSGHIVIADGCSGLRYFVIALTLGYIISYLNNYSHTKTLFVLAIAAIIGLSANWLRIFALVVIGYKTEMQSSLMHDHEYFGWFIFAAISFPAIYFAPVVRKSISKAHDVNPKNISILLPLLVLMIGPLLNILFDSQPTQTAIANILQHELQPISNKKMPVHITSPTAIKTENAVSENSVYIEIDHYQRTQKQEKLVPYIPRLYDNQFWTLTTTKTIDIQNITVALSTFRNKATQKNIVQFQWFNVAGIETHSLVIAKFLQIPALITGKNHFVIISLQAECNVNDCNDAVQKLQKTAQSLSFDKVGK